MDPGQLRTTSDSYTDTGMAVWCTDPLNKPTVTLSNFINQNNAKQGPLFSFTEKKNLRECNSKTDRARKLLERRRDVRKPSPDRK